MFRYLLLSLLLSSLPALAADPPLPDETALAAMTQSDVVLLGEIHDNAAHHLGQAAIIRQIQPKAVLFEMLSPQQAEAVNADLGDSAGLGTRIGWEESGWPPFALYAPIFEALDGAPVVGMALPRAEVRAAFQQGAAAVFGEEAARFGLTRPLPGAEQTAREALQFDAHCAAMPRDMMVGMVAAQRLRDAHFARVALSALARHGAPIVVIVGNGHVRRDWGMPRYFAAADPTVRVFSFAFVEDAQANAPYDGFAATAPVARDDPCAAFRD